VVLARLPACGSRNRLGHSAAHTVGGVATAKYIYVMTDNDVLDEAMDNLREAAQRIRATQNRLRAQRMVEEEVNRELVTRLSTALAMTEAAYLEARRRREM
jgi:hypothetical protein